jgi:hypothetical protein
LQYWVFSLLPLSKPIFGHKIAFFFHILSFTTVCSLVKLNAAVTSGLLQETLKKKRKSILLLYGAILDSCWEKLVALAGELRVPSGQLGSDTCVQLYQ